MDLGQFVKSKVAFGAFLQLLRGQGNVVFLAASRCVAGFAHDLDLLF